MTNQTNATGHTPEALDVSTRAERERCLAIVAAIRAQNRRWIEKVTLDKTREMLEFANDDLDLVRTRIESGETP
jgi:hypothetical protein